MTTCKACEHSGLPILFVYHAAVATDPSFSPALEPADTMPGSPESYKSITDLRASLASHPATAKALGLPDLTHARYVLRTLRPKTYLYVYHDSPSKKLKRQAPQRKNKPADPEAAKWEVFRVMEGGALVPQGDARFRAPAPFSCKEDGGSHIFTTVTYRLQDAHEETTLRVAVSANLWTTKLRKINKSRMQVVDIAAILGGAEPANIIKPPTGEWINTNIADFAVSNLDHGSHKVTYPLAGILRLNGQAQLDRMKVLASFHERTKDKGFVMPLLDIVGTTSSVVDISNCRVQQARAYVASQAHPLGTMKTYEMLRNAVISEIKEKRLPASLKRGDLYDPYDGEARPMFIPADAHLVPKESEMKNWAFYGEMNEAQYRRVKATGKSGVPTSAIFLRRPNHTNIPQVFGYVIAPMEDVVKVMTTEETKRLTDLQAEGAIEKYMASHNAIVLGYEKKVIEHDTDRRLLINSSLLSECFKCEYDSKDPNKLTIDIFPGDVPGSIYMGEVKLCMVSFGGVSECMESTYQRLINAKLTHPDGWLMRGLIGNQEELFASFQSALDNQFNWFTGADAKRDKTYDTLKALMSDDEYAPKFGWLRLPAIGFSLDLHYAVAGIAMHLATKAVLSAPPVAASVHQLSVLSSSMATKINAWGAVFGSLLESILYRKPPNTPILVSVDLTGSQFLALFSRLGELRGGPTVGVSGITDSYSRSQIQALRTASVAELQNIITVRFVTTTHLLRDSSNLTVLSGNSDNVFLRSTWGDTVQMTQEQLAQFYARIHRFDGIKDFVIGAGRLGATATSKTIVGVGKTVADGGTYLSIFGAYLQWQCFLANEKSLEDIDKKLEDIKLTPERRARLEYDRENIKLGIIDNVAGMTGGAFEVLALCFEKMTLVAAPAVLTGFAFFAGSVGAFANSIQNYNRFIKKEKEGDISFANAYRSVSILYGVSGLALVASGVEVLYMWRKYGILLKISLSGATRAVQQAALSTGSRVQQRRIAPKASASGIAIIFMLAAVAAEGIIVYLDISYLERWVKASYFGDNPEFRGKSRLENKSENLKLEMDAFGEALEKSAKAAGQALQQDADYPGVPVS